MHYCKTCKWREQSSATGFNYCQLLAYEDSRPDYPQAGAYAAGHECAAFRITNPDTFGCLCHSDLRPELLI